jgi:hypothetical protein
MFLDFPTVYTDGGFQITFLIGETTGLQSRNSMIRTACFPKGLSANVMLSAVVGSMHSFFLLSNDKKSSLILDLTLWLQST